MPKKIKVINPINKIKINIDTIICSRSSSKEWVCGLTCSDRGWCTQTNTIGMGIRICLKRIR